MLRTCLLLTLVCASAAAAAPTTVAADSNHATIVYDASIREFRCWYEGTLDATARAAAKTCAPPWHAVGGDLHFLRGEAISILVINGVAEDIFAIDLTA